jgi:hypothetical protein
MKWLLCIITTITALSAHTAHHDNEELKVIVEPKWEDLERNKTKITQFGGKWIVVGSITFKKKSKDPIFLTKIDLHWNGAPLEKLTGSLYDKPLDKEFMAIEDVLLCDGCWNKTAQTLILKFNSKKPLNAVNIFYIVLTVPEQLEPTLKHGSFDITATSLPEPIALQLQDSLRLSLDIVD